MTLALENCPVLFQSLVGHSGSTVLQSLFDGHPEVAMFPGVLSFYTCFSEKKDLELRWKTELAMALEHQFKTSSSCNGLGPNQDEVIANISEEWFLRTEKLLQGEAFSRRKLFFALHQAMAEILGQEVSKIKLVWCHEHDVTAFFAHAVPAALEDGLSFRALITVRDPRSHWLSIERLTEKELKQGNLDLKTLNGLYNRCFQHMVSACKAIDEAQVPVDLVKLEDLQRIRFEMGKILAAKYIKSPVAVAWFFPWILRESTSVTFLRLQNERGWISKLKTIAKTFWHITRHNLRMLRHAFEQRSYSSHSFQTKCITSK